MLLVGIELLAVSIALLGFEVENLYIARLEILLLLFENLCIAHLEVGDA
jgi:hypothetical protein